MEALEPKRVDRRHTEPPQPRPGVVEVDWAVSEPKPREVERHAAQAASGQLGDHLAIQKARRRDAVHADHGLAVALLADEALDPTGGEPPPRVAVAGDDLAADHRASLSAGAVNRSQI
jgi:hypothetical protein